MGINRPTDPYDVAGWEAFYAAHPHLMRSVGAAGDDGADGGDAGDAADPNATDADGAEGQDGAEGADDTGKDAGGKDADGKETGDAPEDPKAKKGSGKKPDAKDAKDDADDWRANISDEDLREHASRFASLEELVRGNKELRRERDQLKSKAVVPPGKDASEEEVAAFRKAIGVPDSPDKYEFPELPDEEMTDEVKASREAWAKVMHEHNVPADAAKALAERMQQSLQEKQEAQAQADREFAQQQDQALKKEWGKDYDANKEYATQAVRELASRTGIDLEGLRHKEMKDGRFLLDDADVLRLFAPIGREMSEGTLGRTVDDGERQRIEDEISDLRQKINKAQADGDSRKANELYQKEQQLIAKRDGSQPVVGASGRAA